MRRARDGWLGLPWWWWAYGVVLVIEAHGKFTDTNEGKAILLVSAVLFLVGLAVTFVQRVRQPVLRGLRSAWRFVRSLPSRFPLRVTGTSALASLRADRRRLQTLEIPPAH